MRVLLRILPLLALGAAALPAAADEVELADGSRFPGTVQSLSDGKLKVKTESAGTVTAKWDQVRTLKSDRIFRVVLHDGSVFTGQISLQGEALVIREEGKPAAQVTRALVETIRLAETAWSGTITVSYTAEDGNSSSNKIFASAEIVRETDVDRIHLRGHLLWGEEDGAVTDDSAYGLLKYDRRLSEDVYLYASTEIRTDRFEDLEYRGVVSVGAGYVFIREGGVDLWAEAGPAYIHEEIRDGSSDTWFGGRVSVHLNWKMPFGLELRDDLTYYPNFETLSDWQLHNEGSLSTQLGEHWSLTASVITDLDYRPLPGKTKVDDSYVLGLRYRF